MGLGVRAGERDLCGGAVIFNGTSGEVDCLEGRWLHMLPARLAREKDTAQGTSQVYSHKLGWGKGSRGSGGGAGS